MGVSPVLFYDPARPCRGDGPSGRYLRGRALRPVAADTLGRERHVLSDPSTDADTKGYTEAYFAALERSRRLADLAPATRWGCARSPERAAADKAAAHANTPTMAFADCLGRLFLTVADNVSTRPASPILQDARQIRHRRQRARGDRRARPQRHALRLRHAGQPHPSVQHGCGRALDAQRRDRQADPRLGQPRSRIPHGL